MLLTSLKQELTTLGQAELHLALLNLAARFSVSPVGSETLLPFIGSEICHGPSSAEFL